MLTKRLQIASQTPSGAPPLDPQTPCYVPNCGKWRQIDAMITNINQRNDRANLTNIWILKSKNFNTSYHKS